jgi:hypothetical protein
MDMAILRETLHAKNIYPDVVEKVNPELEDTFIQLMET